MAAQKKFIHMEISDKDKDQLKTIQAKLQIKGKSLTFPEILSLMINNFVVK